MSQKYSQTKALLAITKASLTAMLRSPSALVFSIAFPLIFILLFGFMGGGPIQIKVAVANGSDTSNQFYLFSKKIPNVKFVKDSTDKYYYELLEKGAITAILNIKPNTDTAKALFNIEVISNTASVDKIGLLKAEIESLQFNLDKNNFPQQKTYASVSTQEIPGRIFKEIDFVLPGQLGFSLLSTGLFGVAFLLFNLRETLVLKRYGATPVNRASVLLGEGLARVIFQILVSSAILLLGKYVFGYHMVYGWQTFFELLFMCIIGVFLFMGFGFLISAFAKTINTIPVYTNLLGFPQLLLSGTFFSIDAFPSWLQPIAKALPLTHLNNAMRKIGFSGYSIIDCGMEIGIILLWSLVLYIIAVRLFKWE